MNPITMEVRPSSSEPLRNIDCRAYPLNQRRRNYAPGLAALQRELAKLGEWLSSAGHRAKRRRACDHLSTPLIVKEVFQNERMVGGGNDHWGWAVQGSPADCVKVGLAEFCPRRPDLVVSGLNAGLNAGINVLYSGTVAAAIEGAFYGITSIAVSLQYERHFQFEKAAGLARQIIEQILANKGPDPQLYNINIPTAALSGEPQVRVVPMNVARDSDRFEKRHDPFGRPIIGSAAAGPHWWRSMKPTVPRFPRAGSRSLRWTST